MRLRNKRKIAIVILGCYLIGTLGTLLTAVIPRTVPATIDTETTRTVLTHITELPMLPVDGMLKNTIKSSENTLSNVPTTLANMPESTEQQPKDLKQLAKNDLQSTENTIVGEDESTVEESTVEESKETEEALLNDLLETKKLNEICESNGLQMIVSNIEELKEIEVDLRDEGNIYIKADITMKNTSNQLLEYSPYDFYVKDIKGNVYDYSYNMASSKNALVSGMLVPNGTTQGTICFEVPKDTQLQYIFYTNTIKGIHIAIDTTAKSENPSTIDRTKIPFTVKQSENNQAHVKGIDFKVNGVEVVEITSNSAQPRENREFIRINVTVTNLGIEAYGCINDHFRLLDEYGNLDYWYVSNLVGDNQLFQGDILPNETYTGDLLFEHIKGQEAVLVFQPDIFDRQSLGLVQLTF